MFQCGHDTQDPFLGRIKPASPTGGPWPASPLSAPCLWPHSTHLHPSAHWVSTKHQKGPVTTRGGHVDVVLQGRGSPQDGISGGW